MRVGRMYWRRKIIRCKYNALSVRAEPNRTTKKLSKFLRTGVSTMDKGQGLRNYPGICQTPQLSNKCRRPPLGNVLFETLRARPERCVDSDVSIGFFNDKGGRCVHKMMVAYQILNRIQCGARSRQNVVNNTQFTCVSFGCQVEPKAIIALMNAIRCICIFTSARWARTVCDNLRASRSATRFCKSLNLLVASLTATAWISSNASVCGSTNSCLEGANWPGKHKILRILANLNLQVA